MRVAVPVRPTQRYPSAPSLTASETRGSRSRLDGQRRPALLLTTMASPSSRYQINACRGLPLGSTVARDAKRFAPRKVRMRSGRVVPERFLGVVGLVGVVGGAIAPMVRGSAGFGPSPGAWGGSVGGANASGRCAGRAGQRLIRRRPGDAL